jgi:phospholipid/cholesterol/gamma-HCH transport system substrate-binding protein
MKISNELRVGLLAIVAAALFIWGFYFLKGRNLFSNTTTIYAEYYNLEGLQPSALVVVNGLRVGTVAEIYLKEDGSGKLMVRMEVDNGIQVPKCAIARIKAPDLMGAKQVSIEFGVVHKMPSCDLKNGIVEDNDTLVSASSNLAESFLGTEIDPLVEKTEVILDTVQHWLNGARKGSAVKTTEQMFAEVQQTIHNLKMATDNVNQLVLASNANITKITKNLANVTDNFAKSNEDIQGTLRNANTFTGKLNDLKLGSTVDNANVTIATLQTTIQKMNTILASLNTTIEKANSGTGSLAALMNDRSLYDDLRTSNLQIQLLMQDLRLNPKRYTSILSGKSKPYQAATEQDTINDLKALLAPNQSIKLKSGKNVTTK